MNLIVGNYYVLMSKRGIPRNVKLCSVSKCERYAIVTYSASGKIPHQCSSADLKPSYWNQPTPPTASPEIKKEVSDETTSQT